MHKFFAFAVGLLVGASWAASTQNWETCGTNSINSKSGELIFVANAYNPAKVGFQCLSVNSDSSEYNATWAWPDGRDIVHSYPHVRIQPDLLPIALSDISGLSLSGSWSASLSSKDLDGVATGAEFNIAWDLFADSNSKTAQIDSQARYEVMIWVGTYGDPKPIGFVSGVCSGQTVTYNNVVFTLYCGSSSRANLTTFSWVAASNATSFTIDFETFLQPLISNNLMPSNLYLGVIGFGTEAYYSADNVTFMASNYGANLTSKSLGSSATRLLHTTGYTGYLISIIVFLHLVLLVV